ncbi:MAG: hypothetical protein V7L22_23760 [Nostoc sp.]|uniref:fascin domain-containing protein n=1 Tax=Nostoc sp. TaxID=1180 RepID=UPI002FF6853B
MSVIKKIIAGFIQPVVSVLLVISLVFGFASNAFAQSIPLVSLKTGDTIALRSDTGKYLSRINRGSVNPAEAAKDAIDPYSKFKVTVLDGNKVALQADTGKYLSRINYTSNGRNTIEAAKDTVDPYSQFNVKVLDGGKIALQSDTGKFLSRINYGGAGGQNPIEAAKDAIDPYSQFQVEILP